MKTLRRNLRDASANAKDTELDVFTGEKGKESEDMQIISPGEFKDNPIKYELGLRVNQANLPTEERSDFLGF